MNQREYAILGVLAENDSSRGMDGTELRKATGTKPGTITLTLSELESAGYVEARWQDQTQWPRSKRLAPGETPEAGRDRRRYYRILEEGRRARAQYFASQHVSDRHSPTAAPRPQAT